MKKIIQFIKYNNAFVIIMGLIFAMAGGAFANETSRDAIIGKTIITRMGVDNSQIVGANLGGFNMDFKIVKIMEDERGYNVSYSYNTIYIKDNVWQPLIKEGEMYVAKSGLGDKDLGLYVAEELGQKADSEISYLREVQSIEKTKGIQNQTESVEYTGLKGLVFESEKGKIIGYEPVKEEAEKDKTTTIDAVALTIKSVENKEENKKTEEEKTVQQITVVKETVSKETIMQMVKEAMAQEKGGNSSASASPISSSSSVSVGGGGGTPTSSSSESSSLVSSTSSSESASISEVASSSSSESRSATSEVFPSSQSSSSSTTEVSSSPAASSSSEAVSSTSSSESLPASSSSVAGSSSSGSSVGGAEPAP